MAPFRSFVSPSRHGPPCKRERNPFVLVSARQVYFVFAQDNLLLQQDLHIKCHDASLECMLAAPFFATHTEEHFFDSGWP